MAYVLDASAAMRAPFGSATRLDAARRLLTEHVQAQPTDARLGLWAFGHRQRPADRAASCADVERVVPLLPGQAATIAGRLAGLQAQGLAPLTVALEAAVLDLRSATANRKHVVLVAGSDDTCGRDPCAAVQALAAADAGLKVHVLAVAADPVAMASLRCVAQATGGQFYLATDEARLSQAMAAAATVVAAAPTPPLAAPSSPIAAATTDLTPPAARPTLLPTATALPITPPLSSSATTPARSPEAAVTPTATASATPAGAGPSLPPTAPPQEPTATPFVEARQAVNVRAGPGLVYPVIGRVPAGARLTPLSAYMNLAEDRLWLLVCCLPDGRSGWVAAELVTKAPLDLPTPATVPPTPTPSLPATSTPIPPPTVPPAPTSPPPPPSPEPPTKPPVPTPVP